MVNIIFSVICGTAAAEEMLSTLRDAIRSSLSSGPRSRDEVVEYVESFEGGRFNASRHNIVTALGKEKMAACPLWSQSGDM